MKTGRAPHAFRHTPLCRLPCCMVQQPQLGDIQSHGKKKGREKAFRHYSICSFSHAVPQPCTVQHIHSYRAVDTHYPYNTFSQEAAERVLSPSTHTPLRCASVGIHLWFEQRRRRPRDAAWLLLFGYLPRVVPARCTQASCCAMRRHVVARRLLAPRLQAMITATLCNDRLARLVRLQACLRLHIFPTPPVLPRSGPTRIWTPSSLIERTERSHYGPSGTRPSPRTRGVALHAPPTFAHHARSALQRSRPGITTTHPSLTYHHSTVVCWVHTFTCALTHITKPYSSVPMDHLMMHFLTCSVSPWDMVPFKTDTSFHLIGLPITRFCSVLLRLPPPTVTWHVRTSFPRMGAPPGDFARTYRHLPQPDASWLARGHHLHVI